jgi:hypothetical protein
VLCSKQLVRLRNYKYEETLRYFLLAVGLVGEMYYRMFLRLANAKRGSE